MWATATFTLILAGCGAASSTAGSNAVVGTGFRLTLPVGWSSSPPVPDNGFTTYVLQSSTSGLDISVATLPIPDDPTNPQVAAIVNDDIVTIALTINGTEGVQPQLSEPAHLVTFVGESCARMGLATAAGIDSRIITCRRNQIIFDVSVSSRSTDAPLLATLDDIAAGWSWS
jgi:hypothetical protein